MGVSQNRGFIRENPIEMDDLGVPLSQETTIWFPDVSRNRFFKWFSNQFQGHVTKYSAPWFDELKGDSGDRRWPWKLAQPWHLKRWIWQSHTPIALAQLQHVDICSPLFTPLLVAFFQPRPFAIRVFPHLPRWSSRGWGARAFRARLRWSVFRRLAPAKRSPKRITEWSVLTASHGAGYGLRFCCFFSMPGRKRNAFSKDSWSENRLEIWVGIHQQNSIANATWPESSVSVSMVFCAKPAMSFPVFGTVVTSD